MIDADKDVDGLTPVSAGRLALGIEGLRPCTPQGVMTLLDAAGAQLEGAEAVVIGRSNLFGKPMAQLLLGRQRDGDDVPFAHPRPRRGLPPRGRPDRRRRPGEDGQGRLGQARRDRHRRRHEPHRRTALRGDVDFDAVKEVASAITPVPGGVGPMTIAFLLRNTLQAARMARSGTLTVDSAQAAQRRAARGRMRRGPARGDVRRLVRRGSRRGRRWRSRAWRSSCSSCARWRCSC